MKQPIGGDRLRHNLSVFAYGSRQSSILSWPSLGVQPLVITKLSAPYSMGIYATLPCMPGLYKTPKAASERPSTSLVGSIYGEGGLG